MSDGETTIEVPGLSRPFSLGQLYDGVNDSLIPAVTLWNPGTLKNHVEIQNQKSSNFEVTTEDSFDGRASLLQIEGSMRLGILGGLIGAGSGSAKFLRDNKLSNHHQRVTLHYKCKSKFEHLTMEHFSKYSYQNLEVVEKTKATHVVTGIMYGAEAFFVFNLECDKNDNIKDIKGQMEGAVLRIPVLGAKGSVELNKSEIDNAFTEKFTCRFYGDFHLQENPSTYMEAVQLYKKLPSMLGENGGVPIKVWLLPLECLQLNVVRMVNRINKNVVKRVEDAFQDLEDFYTKCNDLLAETCCSKFPGLNSRITIMQSVVEDYKGEFQRQIMNILPNVKGNDISENELLNILRARGNSPFSSVHLKTWLDEEGYLISVLNTVVANLQNIEFSSAKNPLPSWQVNIDFDYLVCLMFKLGTNEELIKTLKTYIDSMHFVEKPSVLKSVRKKLPNDFLEDFKEKVKQFKEFADANISNKKTKFLVAEDTDKTQKPGVSICLFPDSKQKFPYSPPMPIETLARTEIQHNSLIIEWPLQKEENISSSIPYLAWGLMIITFLVIIVILVWKANIFYFLLLVLPLFLFYWMDGLTLLQPKKKLTFTAPTGYNVKYTNGIEEKMTETKQNHITISNLRLDTTYQIYIQLRTRVGLSNWSEPFELKTYPVSPPGKPFATLKSGNLRLQWGRPNQISANCQIKHYQIEYQVVPSNTWKIAKTVKECETELHFDFDTSENYTVTFCVSAYTGQLFSRRSKPSSLIKINKCQMLNPRGKINTSVKQSLTEHSSMLCEGPPRIFRLPFKEVFRDKTIRKCEIGTCCLGKSEKVLLIVGETGVGKTTLISAMLNFIIGVNRVDNFRFHLPVDPNEASPQSQSVSQTQWVSVYTIHHQKNFTIPYTLTIVDTPGFGDTRDSSKERKTTKVISEFLRLRPQNAIGHLNAICIVVNGSERTITRSQRIALNSLMSMFQRDIFENLCQIMVTFATDNSPSIVNAFTREYFQCSSYFHFNNSSLFANNTEIGEEVEEVCINTKFWKFNSQSFRKFFDSLQNSNDITLDLCVSKD